MEGEGEGEDLVEKLPKKRKVNLAHPFQHKIPWKVKVKKTYKSFHKSSNVCPLNMAPRRINKVLETAPYVGNVENIQLLWQHITL